MPAHRLGLPLVLGLLSLAVGPIARAGDNATAPGVARGHAGNGASSGQVPVWFEPLGPSGFVANRPWSTLTLDADGVRAVLGAGVTATTSTTGAPRVVGDSEFRLSFVGGRHEAPSGERRLPGVSHYFLGSDPAGWRTNVPQFGAVRYREVLPGVDAVFYGDGGILEYDIVLSPGIDVSSVRLSLDGATSLHIDAAGDLVARAGDAAIKQRRPVAYQDHEGRRTPVDVAFDLAGGTLGFRVGDYDRERPLVIDPVVVVFGTFVGGEGLEFVELSIGSITAGVATDAAGNVFVAGDSASTSVVPGGPTTALGTPNVFVVKMNAAGSQVLFATFVGGSGTDARGSIALDATGSAFVSGRTNSLDFPVTSGSIKAAIAAGDQSDAFLVRLDANGVLDYGTYFGGTGQDNGEAVAVSGSRAVFVGSTSSPNFPTTANAAQTTRGGAPGCIITDPACIFDAFVAVVDFSASPTLAYSSYLGGGGSDAAFSVAIDGTGRIVAAGQTRSSDFPTSSGAFDTTLGGAADAFVTRFAANGAIDYSTYFGGTVPANDIRENAKVAVDAAGLIYIAGPTTATDLPVGTTPSPFQANKAAGTDAFVAKLWPEAPTPAGQLVYRTYFGGSADDLGLAVMVDASGRAYMVGYSTSDNLPVANALYSGRAGAEDGFIARFSPSGSTLEFGTYLGGTQTDYLLALDYTTRYGLYTFGLTASPTPVPLRSEGGGPAIDSVLGGARDAFVTRLQMDVDDDGMDDFWEAENGLNPSDGSDATGDADGDGATNLKEFTDGTDPRASVKRYLAEGATIAPFSTRIAVLNDDATRTASLVMEFLTTNGTVLTASRTIPPMSRITVEPKTQVAGLAAAEFSTTLTSNLTIVADRTMMWDETIYAAHAETAVQAPSATWYLAEGATIGGFNLFYLIQNPNGVPADVTVRYLLAVGAPVEKVYTVPPRSRANIWVNFEVVQGVSLDNQELSAVLTTAASTPIIVERAMYSEVAGEFFGAGHESAGVTAPATSWRLAEGATGDFFDLFILIANPNATPVNVTATYLLPGGATVTHTYQPAANSRFNIWVNLEPGLASTAVSTVIDSNQPIIVERAMWWPGNSRGWREGHNSPGATQTGTRWVLAEGEAGPPGRPDTYILVANTSAFAGTVQVTLLFEDGTAPLTKLFSVPANSRTNVLVSADIGDASLVGKRFGAIVESLGTVPAQLVVERAMYWTTGGEGQGGDELARCPDTVRRTTRSISRDVRARISRALDEADVVP